MSKKTVPPQAPPPDDLRWSKPQLLVVERMVIARCVRSTADRQIFASLMRADDFTDDCRSWIFEAVKGLPDCDQVIAKSICDRASGPNLKEAFGTSFADRCVAELRYCIDTAEALDGQSTAAARQYAADLRDAAIVRKLVEMSSRAINASQQELVTNWGDWVQKYAGYVEKMASKRLQAAPSGPESIGAVADAFLTYLAAPEASAALQSVGVSGIGAVDRVIGPLQRSEVYAIAAEPGAGKSAFALQLARTLSVNKRTMVFTMEMAAEKQFQRMVAGYTGINTRAFKLGNLDPADMQAAAEAAEVFRSLLLTFKELPTRKYEDMVTAIRAEHATQPLDVVFIDYLQLLSSHKRYSNRDAELGDISKGLKALAMELKICVVAIVAINREAPKDGRPPAMRDLRECGVLEYDAHTIMALWRRPEGSDEGEEKPRRGFGRQYGSQTMARPQFGASNPDYYPIELHLLKQRDGEKGAIVQLYFWPKVTGFSDYVPEPLVRHA